MNEVQRQYECPERGRSIRQFFRSPIQLVSSYIYIVGLDKVLIIPLRRDKVMDPMPETIVESKVMGPMLETIVVGSLICMGDDF